MICGAAPLSQLIGHYSSRQSVSVKPSLRPAGPDSSSRGNIRDNLPVKLVSALNMKGTLLSSALESCIAGSGGNDKAGMIYRTVVTGAWSAGHRTLGGRPDMGSSACTFPIKGNCLPSLPRPAASHADQSIFCLQVVPPSNPITGAHINVSDFCILAIENVNTKC